MRKIFSGNTASLPRVNIWSVIDYFVTAAKKSLARPKQQSTRGKYRRCSTMEAEKYRYYVINMGKKLGCSEGGYYLREGFGN